MEKDHYNSLLTASKETGLPMRKLLDVFSFLKGGPIDNNELVRLTGVSRNVLNSIKSVLSAFFMPPTSKTTLSQEGEKAAESLGVETEEEFWRFLTTGEEYELVLNIVQDIASRRPVPVRELDQFSATVDTIARRAALMHFNADLAGKRVLFLGDDDHTSVAVNALSEAESVTVLDIDDRILKSVAALSTNEIVTAQYDARLEVPEEHNGQFDVVFTDPPYTSEGITLFVSRAISMLDLNNQAARIYLCYGNSDRAKERFLPVYQALVDSGLMIRWVFDKFNRYDGAESIGSSSSLFICDVTPKTKPLVKGKANEPIYTTD